MFIDICIPVYNEEKILKENILKLLNYCEKQNFEFIWKIVIIVNGSSDNSLEISEKLVNEHQRSIVCFNIKEPGKGNALKKYWSKCQADIVVYMDIDLAVSLDNLPSLINPILKKQADLVIGSRLLPNSKTNRTFIREFSSRSYNSISRIILNYNFSDLQCGFKAIKKSALKKITPHIKDNKWFFDTELVVFADYFNYKIKEIPVDWEENRYDQRKSKVNLIKDGFKFLFNLVKLKIRIKKLKKYEINSNNTGFERGKHNRASNTKRSQGHR